MRALSLRKAVLAGTAAVGLIVGAGVAPVAAATTTTSATASATASCFGSTGFNTIFTVDATAPDEVPAGSSYSLHVVAHIDAVFGIPAPYSGALTTTFRFAVTGGTPAAASVTLPAAPFNQGDLIPAVTFDVPITATASPGSAVDVTFTEFDYVIVPQASPSSLSWRCPITNTPQVGHTLVIATPLTADDCKRGGWQHRVDGQGHPFRNQGQCVSYAVRRRA